MSTRTLLDRYAARLGLADSATALADRAQGSPGQVLALIDELLAAHTQAIVFENLDVVAARMRGETAEIPIELGGVAVKLLDAGRGGYCHEHARLVQAVMADLGISAHPVLARIHLGEGRTEPGGLTHQATIITVDERRFLVDPGFGSGTPEVAIELSTEASSRVSEHGEHRLAAAEPALEPSMKAEAEWVLQSRTASDQDFRNVYAFADISRERSDIDLSNWYTATKPGTRFTGPPILARSLPAGAKVTLEGRQLRHVRYGADAERTERTIVDSDDFAEVLAADFGLRVEREFSDLVWSGVEGA